MVSAIGGGQRLPMSSNLGRSSTRTSAAGDTFNQPARAPKRCACQSARSTTTTFTSYCRTAFRDALRLRAAISRSSCSSRQRTPFMRSGLMRSPAGETSQRPRCFQPSQSAVRSVWPSTTRAYWAWCGPWPARGTVHRHRASMAWESSRFPCNSRSSTRRSRDQ